MLYALTGLIAGALHVFSGPDHLSAIAPLSVEKGKSSWKIGFLWGLGHSGGVLVVGIIVLLGREIIPIERISTWSERLVGVVLIGLGLWGLRKVLTDKVHSHPHVHAGIHHEHIHLHKKSIVHAEPSAHVHIHAAFGVGIIHGLAGSSHFLGVLPALALPTTMASIVYLSGYGIGTILSMAAFSSIIGITAHKLADNGVVVYKRMLLSFSLFAVFVGCVWILS